MLLVFILQSLYSEIHVSTNSSAGFIIFHVIVHFVKGSFFRAQSYVEQNCKFCSYLSTEAIEKPIVRGKLSSVFIFCDKEQIHFDHRGVLFLLVQGHVTISFVFLLVLERTKSYINSVRIEKSELISCLNVLLTVRFCLTECFENNWSTFPHIVCILSNQLLFSYFFDCKILIGVLSFPVL